MPHTSSSTGRLTDGHDLHRLAALALAPEPSLAEQTTAGKPWTSFGGLDLHEEIGRGGMGVVYRARQRGLDRVVAVKVLLRAQFAGAEERERFHREAQAAARLRHPGIVSIIDVGEDDGVPWFSMEHIAGKSLEQLVREHPMDAHEAAKCVQSIAQALQHAHEHGVLHRDLKPSNILLDEENAPHITDFGIARIGTSSTTAAQLTRTGQMLGSPGYAAPEQALAGSADVRTDVYGLGALLYHLLTGRPPFQGPTLDAILVQLRENEPLSPRKLNPSVPRDLETICLKCLQKAPEARYTSATAVAEDLGRFLDGSAILARPISLPGRLWRWTRRHPGIAAMLAIIMLLVSGLVGGSLAFARHQARMEHRTSLISEARSLRQTRLAGARSEALSKLREAAAISSSSEIQNEVIACLALPEMGAMQRHPASAHAAPDSTRSADGRRVAVFDQSDVIIRDATSGAEIARLPGFKPGSLMKLDDHGTRLAIAEPGKGALKLINVSDARLIATCEHPLFLHSLDWSGELIATTCDNRFIYLWQTDGTLKHRLSGHEAVPIRVAFRPRSQELVSTSQDTHVRLWHAARGEEIVRRVQEHQGHRTLWWSDDGRTLFGRCDDGHIESFAFTPSEVFQLLAPPQEEPHSENLGSAAISSDGRLAAVIDEVSCRVWDFDHARVIRTLPKAPGQWLSALFARDNSKLWLSGWDVPLTSHSLAREGDTIILGAPSETKIRHGSLLRAASADNQHLVLSNNGTGEFIVFTPASQRIVRVKHPGTLACAIANDGSWLVTSSYRSKDLRLWSLPDGKLQRTLIADDTVMQLLLTPAGTQLFCNVGKSLRCFDTSTWAEQPMPIATTPLHGLALSPDGQTLASLGDDHIRLLDISTLKERQRLILPSYVGWLGDAHLVFDQSGRHLMVHTALGSVCRWNLQQLNHETTGKRFVK